MNKKYLILKKSSSKYQSGGLFNRTTQVQPVGAELAQLGAQRAYGSFKSAKQRGSVGNGIPMAQFGSSTTSALEKYSLGPKKSALESALGANYGMTADTNAPHRGLSNAAGLAPKQLDGNLGGNLSKSVNPNVMAGIGAGLGAAQIGSDFLFNNASEKNSRTDGFGNEIFDQKDANLATGQGAASGALKGAQMGMSFGPWGAAIGGAVGGIAGLIGGKKKGEKALTAYDDRLDKNMMTASRNQDMQLSKALTGKQGTKLEKKNLGTFKLPKKKSSSLVLRSGGKLETPGEVNVVVKGKLHKENNNLGNKDKGVPVIDANGTKEYEVEKQEIIFRQDTTHLIEASAKIYKDTEDDKVLEDLGTVLAKELLENTQDNDGKFGVKVKEDEN